MIEALHLRLLHVADRIVARYARDRRKRSYFRWRARRLIARMDRDRGAA